MRPLPLRLRHVAALHGAVGPRQLALLLDGDAGEAVVGRIAEHDEDRLVLLDGVGVLALLLEFREGQRLGRVRLPAGQGVGQEDAGAFVVPESCAQLLQCESDFEVGDDQRARA